MLHRRELLKSLVTAAIAAAGTRMARASEQPSQNALFFVPGYQPELGRLGGMPLDKHPGIAGGMPRGYDGPTTLIARLDERSRAVRRALMPLQGHHVAIDPGGKQAFFSAMDGKQMVRFDPQTLAILDIVSRMRRDSWAAAMPHGRATAAIWSTPSGGHTRASPARRPITAAAS